VRRKEEGWRSQVEGGLPPLRASQYIGLSALGFWNLKLRIGAWCFMRTKFQAPTAMIKRQVPGRVATRFCHHLSPLLNEEGSLWFPWDITRAPTARMNEDPSAASNKQNSTRI
jgi:hypothetical protein